MYVYYTNGKILGDIPQMFVFLQKKEKRMMVSDKK